MRLIKPSHKILRVSIDPLGLIEECGRTCYRSEDKIGPGTAERFARMILDRGHKSVIEHASATVRIVCDRGVSHELVRHRVASFSQESTRYCDYNGGHIAFVIPPWVDAEPGEYDRSLGTLRVSDTMWFDAMLYAEKTYKGLRAFGPWRPEQARSVLPNSLATELVITANLREWRHIFKLRCMPGAHPQAREVMTPLLEEIKQLVPVIFDRIKPPTKAV